MTELTLRETKSAKDKWVNIVRVLHTVKDYSDEQCDLCLHYKHHNCSDDYDEICPLLIDDICDGTPKIGRAHV